jgi:hypothetical protein
MRVARAARKIGRVVPALPATIGTPMELMRRLFGPSQAEIWERLAREVGGDFTKGGFARPARVDVRVGEWTITLDTFSIRGAVCTRMRAPYVNPDGFRFTVYRHGPFSDLGKLLGMQDLAIGDAEFDQRFIVKSNDEAKVRRLLNDRIRAAIMAQPSMFLEVRDDEGWFGTTFPDGVDELHFMVLGLITDLDRLKTLYGLFGDVLHELCRMGSAYEDDPHVTLS